MSASKYFPQRSITGDKESFGSFALLVYFTVSFISSIASLRISDSVAAILSFNFFFIMVASLSMSKFLEYCVSAYGPELENNLPLLYHQACQWP